MAIINYTAEKFVFSAIKPKSTEDYLLQDLPFNRESKPVDNLVSNMKKKGFAGTIDVIKTNVLNPDGKVRLYISDGHHRRKSAVEANVSYSTCLCKEFIADKKTSTDEAKKALVDYVSHMNNSQVKWNNRDYAEAFQYLKYNAYMTIIAKHDQLKEEDKQLTKIITFDTLANIYGTISSSRKLNDLGFKEGTFKIACERDALKTIEIIKKLKIDLHGHFKLNSRMVLSLHSICNLSSFDYRYFVENAIKNRKCILGYKDTWVDIFKVWGIRS